MQADSQKKVRYIYFFRGTLRSHVHFYKGWVDAARNNGLPMEMLTFIPLNTYLKQKELVKKYKKIKYFRIYICLPKTDFLITLIYFFLIALLNDRVIVHLKKRSTIPFEILKYIFKDKLSYIVDLEGDYESEKDFLLKHPYKDGFYNHFIQQAEQKSFQLRKTIVKSDYVIVVTQKFKEIIMERYPELDLNQKITVLPTGIDINKYFYSEEIRQNMRKMMNVENKFVMVYIGNAYYSWQNVYRTIEIFKLIKRKVKKESFLLLLIRKQDHYIVKEFLDKLGISQNDCCMKEVNQDRVPYYLNASDLGVLLRHKHTMNKVASPGKFGDYIASGLPVLLVEGTSIYSNEINKTNFGIVLKDMDDDEEIIQKITPFLLHDKNKRENIINWAREQFSTEAHVNEYIEIFEKAIKDK